MSDDYSSDEYHEVRINHRPVNGINQFINPC